VADLKAEIDSVNRERKLQQTAAGQELAALEAEWQVSRRILVRSAACATSIVHT
jgi:Breast carcinoma amplified sequence 2 (BCAS2)